ncbi:hypothetical protein CEQ90_15940 [Lewinellaceae bacterium SD302]|nr:hypothetical protein CEQ90_15940 [Lewinellaceae bacterium SD302]
MTLTTLLISIAIAAVILTLLTHFVFKSVKSWPVSLLQNFCGALFVFSGYVKAVDPLGTAYKMEQYFAEFESTFADTTFSFLAPIFPWLGEFVVAFSVFMIVLEIVLGVMLIMGHWRKFTAWLFFIIVAFFTVLTGFTFLTGYVPSGVNFFDFGGWGPYVETNMKVTDCGCFGDFLKLEPYTSFLKDVFLMVPAILFLFTTRKMHQVFNPLVRNLVTAVATFGLILYCFSNFLWDIPGQDFRPFKVGTDIAAQKLAEEDAAANIQVLGYEIENKETGEVTSLSMNEYLEQYKNFPETEYSINQLTTDPVIEPTKISEFELSNASGEDIVPQLLEVEAPVLFIVAYDLKGEQTGTTSKTITEQEMRIDTIGTVDETNLTRNGEIYDTNYVDVEREITVPVFTFPAGYLAKWTDHVQPVINEARAAGINVIAATKYADPDMIAALKEQVGADYNFVQGDDIMLKTIIRSNPGVLLLKKGVILDKWHYRKLPSFNELKVAYGLGE